VVAAKTESPVPIASVPTPKDLEVLAALLSGAGFIAAEEEADELLACAAGDVELLRALVRRRLTGEPLGWITGNVSFCGLKIRVDPGVFVPRRQSEPLARRAVEHLPTNDTAIDLCAGACATANGVEVYWGDLFAPLPRTLEGRVDVVVGVVPYER
jgi:release factor glutamine methyltransferase